MEERMSRLGGSQAVIGISVTSILEAKLKLT